MDPQQPSPSHLMNPPMMDASQMGAAGGMNAAMGGIPPPMGSMGDLADATDSMTYLPEVNGFRSAILLSIGVTVRYAVACGVWTGMRYVFWHLKNKLGKQTESPENRNKRLKRDLRLWARSFGLDLLASFVFPSRCLPARCVPRLLFDFTFPTLGNVISIVDLFSPPHYLAYAMDGYRPFDAETSDLSYWTWSLPRTLVSVGKLVQRCRKHGRARTKVGRCSAAIVGQFLIRGFFGLMAPSLPMNIYELLLGGVVTGLDKWLDAYLIRNTDPWILDEEQADQGPDAETSTSTTDAPEKRDAAAQ